jgi:hypothetical protein
MTRINSDYIMQMTLMEKRIGYKENPLSIVELEGDLNLRCERYEGLYSVYIYYGKMTSGNSGMDLNPRCRLLLTPVILRLTCHFPFLAVVH